MRLLSLAFGGVFLFLGGLACDLGFHDKGPRVEGTATYGKLKWSRWKYCSRCGCAL